MRIDYSAGQAVGPATIFQQRLPLKRKAASRDCQTQPQIKVLRPSQFRIEHSNLDKRLAPRHDAGRNHTAPGVNQFEKIKVPNLRRIIHPGNHVARSFVDRVAKEGRVRASQVAAAGPDELHLILEIIRQPKIVAVEKGNKLTARSLQPGITRNTRAAVFLLQINDAIEIRLERVFKIYRVRRSVVDDDHLIIGERLREY